MFRYLLKKIGFYIAKSQHSTPAHEKGSDKQALITGSLKDNLSAIKSHVGESNDIVYRDFRFGDGQCMMAYLIFVDGLVDEAAINQTIIKPLLYDSKLMELHADELKLDFVEQAMVSMGSVSKVNVLYELLNDCLSGNAILLVDGWEQALSISCRGWAKRGIEEPQTEAVIRGSREGFTETLRVNTALLRRRIKTPNLTFESMMIGRQTHTDITIAYIRDLASPKLIQDVKERLNAIDTDAILESGYIEQYIEDEPFSLFSTMGSSEKPDVVAGKLLEGRVAIIVDGTPFVLTVPTLFVENFQGPEDYYSRPFFASFVRILRFIGYSISILAPAIYVALTTFHQELIPTKLLFSMAAASEGVPFPTVIEAALMIITFEILREAGLRLPRAVGQAVSIVGALVVGESAVSAGLIGAPMVIVVAITAVSSFVVPSLNDSSAILRIIFLVLAGVMGSLGIVMGLLCLFIHLCSLKSFGMSYMMPFAPVRFSDLKDSVIRAPLWTMLNRPFAMARSNTKRNTFHMPPEMRTYRDYDQTGVKSDEDMD